MRLHINGLFPKDWLPEKIVSLLKTTLFVFHKNDSPNIFDKTVAQQGLEAVKSTLYNPLENLYLEENCGVII